MNWKSFGRKGRTPPPVLVLATVLVLGGILALLLSGPPADSQEKAARALEDTREQCEELLKQENYEKLSALYDSVSQYPQCQVEIKAQLKDHVVTAMVARDVRLIPKAHGAFAKTDALLGVVMEGIREGAAKLYENSYADFMIFHQALTAEGFCLEELDAYVMGYILEQLDVGDYTFAGAYIHILDHCQVCAPELVRQVEQRVTTFLQNGQYEDANLLYGQLRYWDMKEDVVGPAVLDRAREILETDPHNARYLLQMLKDYKHPVYDLEAEYSYRLATLYVYIKEGKLTEAENYAMSFAGEMREKLLEALRSSQPGG